MTDEQRRYTMKSGITLLYGMLFMFSLSISAAEADLLTVSSLFTQMDIDKDGLINRNEINKRSLLADEFETVDRNRDGSLDQIEFEIFIAQANM